MNEKTCTCIAWEVGDKQTIERDPNCPMHAVPEASGELRYSAVSGHIENGRRTQIDRNGKLKAMLEIYDISPEDNNRVVAELIRALEWKLLVKNNEAI